MFQPTFAFSKSTSQQCVKGQQCVKSDKSQKSVFFVNFEQIPRIILVFPLLALNK